MMSKLVECGADRVRGAACSVHAGRGAGNGNRLSVDGERNKLRGPTGSVSREGDDRVRSLRNSDAIAAVDSVGDGGAVLLAGGIAA